MSAQAIEGDLTARTQNVLEVWSQHFRCGHDEANSRGNPQPMVVLSPSLRVRFPCSGFPDWQSGVLFEVEWWLVQNRTCASEVL